MSMTHCMRKRALSNLAHPFLYGAIFFSPVVEVEEGHGHEIGVGSIVSVE